MGKITIVIEDTENSIGVNVDFDPDVKPDGSDMSIAQKLGMVALEMAQKIFTESGVLKPKGEDDEIPL